MSTNEDYNGWSNRETWAVALHVDNERSTYEERRAAVAQSWEDAGGDAGGVTAAVADWLKDFVESEAELVFHDPANASEWGRMMASDVGSLWRVDWWEIARSWVDEYVVEQS